MSRVSCIRSSMVAALVNEYRFHCHLKAGNADPQTRSIPMLGHNYFANLTWHITDLLHDLNRSPQCKRVIWQNSSGL